ncbi:MAG TPA: glycoside hydrolase family 36 protein [Chitinophagaceae bacterium]|nr:glycoside hydrolase family 36 protein [Chitinophagaceae bacterium]
MKLAKFLSVCCIFLFLVLAGTTPVFGACVQPQLPPPNAPSEVTVKDKELVIRYNDQVLFHAEFNYMDSDVQFNQVVDEQSGKINQVYKWSSEGKPLTITGVIEASDESFPCVADAPYDTKNIVRHTIGLSNSLLNRAVYDRKSDWVLSVDRPAHIRITPVSNDTGNHKFKVEISGNSISIRFRPRFYQKHRGLSYFEPWNYKVWKPSVAGWCSWFAYFSDITEDKIKHTADVIAKELKPYGLDYLQIDDGYQQKSYGLPASWLQGNDKFPSGLGSLSNYILSKGLKPGIWTNVSFNEKDFAFAHKELFVRDDAGKPAHGNWVGYVMDGSNPATLNTLIKPLYQGLKDMGWAYFKVDALRHLRYEGYNSYKKYFDQKGINRVKTYRHLVQAIRNEIGENNFMMGCWGIRPELIGIIDACRIGGDGFGYAGLTQYNSFNNVVWRNDPDHIVLSAKEAFPSCMVTSMTGSLFMLTDKPEVYTTELAEAAKRSMPVMFTRPGQLYDVDASRSSELGRVNSALSGDGPRVFDAGQNDNKDYLYLLEVNEPYENWMLLGRIGGEEQRISFDELGLDNGKEYLVFEFWSKSLLGSFHRQFNTGAMNTKYHCQLFCIRERKGRPQLLATNRHITCGAFDIIDMHWKDGKLSGKSKVMKEEAYTLYLTEPEGYEFSTFECPDAEVVSVVKKGMMRIISLKANSDKPVSWTVSYH